MEPFSIVFTILLLLSKVIIGLLIWAVKDLYAQNKSVCNELAEFKVMVAERYATKEYFEGMVSRIENKLDKLFDDIHRT